MIFWCAGCVLRSQATTSKQRDFTFLSLLTLNFTFWFFSTAPAVEASKNDET